MADEREVERRQRYWGETVPAKFRGARIADFPQPTASELMSWAAVPSGRNLVLFGPTGTGKTRAALATCRPVVEAGGSLVFAPVSSLLRWLRPEGDPDTHDRCRYASRLVLDDLGHERSTAWAVEQVYDLLNWRWMEARPTVATTNLDPLALEEAIGSRLYSRLVGDGAVLLRFGGPDRRRVAGEVRADGAEA